MILALLLNHHKIINKEVRLSPLPNVMINLPTVVEAMRIVIMVEVIIIMNAIIMVEILIM
jgi:hypothetical protein